MQIASSLAALMRQNKPLAKAAYIPHYFRDYDRHVKSLLLGDSKFDAMSQAVGGEYIGFGKLMKILLVEKGLQDGMSVIDVGCGSGRLAYAMREMKIDYLGVDVIPELVTYARELCGRSDWRFEVTRGLNIPAEDETADVVVFFSVFTHLRHEESYAYLMEAARVAKKGGTIVFSFLDFSQQHVWAVFERMVQTVRAGETVTPLDQFISAESLPIWAKHLGLEIVETLPGAANYIALDHDIKLDNGNVLSKSTTLGQSVCIMRRPA